MAWSLLGCWLCLRPSCRRGLGWGSSWGCRRRKPHDSPTPSLDTIETLANFKGVIQISNDFLHTGEILYDIKPSNGKEVAWKQRRLITLRLAQAYKRIKSDKYHRIINCAGYMEFKRFSDNTMKLHTANFCKTRLCPTCNWRRSKKLFAQVSKIMDDIENDYEFLFLTLTCESVSGDNLNSQIDSMILAFKLLCLRKQFKKVVRGWCRALEMNYNWETKKYNPHFHVILIVDKGYFKSDDYITQDDFCFMWQSCLNVEYDVVTDIRTFKDSERGKGKEVAEVAKYTIKTSNIMANLQGTTAFNQDIQDAARKLTDKITDEIVFTLDAALKSRRLIGYGGIFKQKHKELNLDEDLDGDLIRTTDEVNEHEGLMYEIERYRWDIGLRNYIKIEPATMSEEEGEL